MFEIKKQCFNFILLKKSIEFTPKLFNLYLQAEGTVLKPHVKEEVQSWPSFCIRRLSDYTIQSEMEANISTIEVEAKFFSNK
jgi:hypothetical protein